MHGTAKLNAKLVHQIVIVDLTRAQNCTWKMRLKNRRQFFFFFNYPYITNTRLYKYVTLILGYRYRYLFEQEQNSVIDTCYCASKL